jgi:hypothetical protein
MGADPVAADRIARHWRHLVHRLVSGKKDEAAVTTMRDTVKQAEENERSTALESRCGNRFVLHDV